VGKEPFGADQVEEKLASGEWELETIANVGTTLRRSLPETLALSERNDLDLVPKAASPDIDFEDRSSFRLRALQAFHRRMNQGFGTDLSGMDLLTFLADPNPMLETLQELIVPFDWEGKRYQMLLQRSMDQDYQWSSQEIRRRYAGDDPDMNLNIFWCDAKGNILDGWVAGRGLNSLGSMDQTGNKQKRRWRSILNAYLAQLLGI
jgi:hypothetical protein